MHFKCSSVDVAIFGMSVSILSPPSDLSELTDLFREKLIQRKSPQIQLLRGGGEGARKTDRLRDMEEGGRRQQEIKKSSIGGKHEM